MGLRIKESKELRDKFYWRENRFSGNEVNFLDDSEILESPIPRLAYILQLGKAFTCSFLQLGKGETG